jgi:hypothetical protein
MSQYEQGRRVGCEVGCEEGCELGCEEGCELGRAEGCAVGCVDGCDEGCDDGCDEGSDDGCDDGCEVGFAAVALFLKPISRRVNSKSLSMPNKLIGLGLPLIVAEKSWSGYLYAHAAYPLNKPTGANGKRSKLCWDGSRRCGFKRAPNQTVSSTGPQCVLHCCRSRYGLDSRERRGPRGLEFPSEALANIPIPWNPQQVEGC